MDQEKVDRLSNRLVELITLRKERHGKLTKEETREAHDVMIAYHLALSEGGTFTKEINKTIFSDEVCLLGAEGKFMFDNINDFSEITCKIQDDFPFMIFNYKMKWTTKCISNTHREKKILNQ